MKPIRIILLSFMVFISSISLTGCWNYREVDQMAVVAGVAVDKGINHKYRITVEIVQITGGRETKTTSKRITVEGNTMFDAVRNEIALSGKRLYWSHAKILIISQELAREGVTKIIDWYSRDSETRTDVHLIISGGESAGEVFEGKGTVEGIKSFEIDDMIKNNKSLSKIPQTEIWEFTNDLAAKGLAATAPVIYLEEGEGGSTFSVEGTAIFKGDRLIGFIDGEQTKDMLFVKNEIKGGVLVENGSDNDEDTPISLEIFKNKTRVEPVVYDNNIEINISTDTITAIDEIDGTKNYIEEAGRKKLEQDAEKTLKIRIESLIKKMQWEYGVDIFGFGAKLREDKPQIWNKVAVNWGDKFKDLKVNVKTKVHIRNSAMLSKPLEVSD